MSLMVAEVYDALRAINVPEEQARRAATAVAEYRQPGIVSDLRVLKWMVGTNVALTLAVVVKLLLV